MLKVQQPYGVLDFKHFHCHFIFSTAFYCIDNDYLCSRALKILIFKVVQK